jgi:hypothetical protein
MIIGEQSSSRAIGARSGGLVQEVLKEDEPKEEIQECPDHCPSFFEKGKPWSILRLPLITLTG